MKDCFKPHRNLADESHLKEIIEKIQSQMHEPESHSIIEALLKEAEAYIKAPNRILDLTVIEQYDEWTDLDGLVGELTMEVPKPETISEEDFLSIVQYIQETIATEQFPDTIRADYWLDFYREFFALNFPNAEPDELLDEIMESASPEELVRIAFSNK